jgi:hypothetical protein
MQKNDMDSSESAGAKSETPNHAFAPNRTSSTILFFSQTFSQWEIDYNTYNS